MRITCGGDAFLAKEQLWEHLDEFVDGTIEFYGGDMPSSSVSILEHALPELLNGASQVMHVDIHSGLGRWGEFKLLLDAEEAASDSDCWQRFAHAFPSDVLEAVNSAGLAAPPSTPSIEAPSMASTILVSVNAVSASERMISRTPVADV